MILDQAVIIPVYEGVPILKAWQARPLASEALHREITTALRTRASVRAKGGEMYKLSQLPIDESHIDIDDDIMEDIKVRLCFVTSLKRGKQIQVSQTDCWKYKVG